jgi:hypothetical protein
MEVPVAICLRRWLLLDRFVVLGPPLGLSSIGAKDSVRHRRRLMTARKYQPDRCVAIAREVLATTFAQLTLRCKNVAPAYIVTRNRFLSDWLESYDMRYLYTDSGTIGLIVLKDFRLVILACLRMTKKWI